MPSLGKLWYTVNLKDMTDADLEKINKKLNKLNVSIDTSNVSKQVQTALDKVKSKKIPIKADIAQLKADIQTALSANPFKIKVVVAAASAQGAVRQALQQQGLQKEFTAGEKRQYDAVSKRMLMEAKAQTEAAKAAKLYAQQQNYANRTRQQSNRLGQQSWQLTGQINQALQGQIHLTSKLSTLFGVAYSATLLKSFLTKVIQIGGELEKQKLAMTSILGDKGQADVISSKINTLAVKSPFGVLDLNQYAKQLTAFQIPFSDLYDTLNRMADISSAVGVDMGRIILAYGQVKAATVLKGTELRQFTEANIPMLDMLAKRFTKLKGEIISTGDVLKMISNKEVAFADVKAVLEELTDEGGRFYNMQAVLSEGLAAKWKNLGDAVDLMFGEVANSSMGGFLKSMANTLTDLTKQWRSLATAIGLTIGFSPFIAFISSAKKLYDHFILLNGAVDGFRNKMILFGNASVKVFNRIILSLKKLTVALVKNPLTYITAVIATISTLWGKQQTENAGVDNMQETLLNRATEAAKNLKDALENVKSSAEDLADTELRNGIEKLTQLVKDYSETASQDISDTLINDKGEVASLAEQYDKLVAKVKELQSAAEEASKINLSNLFAMSVDKADGGWFDDNLLTDVKDFVNYFNKVSADGKTIAEIIEEFENYSTPEYAPNMTAIGGDVLAISDMTKPADETSELINEWTQTIKELKKKLIRNGLDPSNLSPEISRSLAQAFNSALDGLPGAMKKKLMDTASGIITGFKFEPDELQTNIVKTFTDALKAASPQLANALRYGSQTYNTLSKAEKEIVDNLIDQAVKDTRQKFPEYATELQNMLDGADFTAKITMLFAGENQTSEIQQMLWKNPGVVTPEATRIFENWSNGANSVKDVKDNALKDAKDVKEQLDEAKKNKHTTPEHKKQLQDKYANMEFAYKNAGFGDLTTDLNTKKSKKDTFAEDLKQRFQDLKDAWELYKKWSETLSKEAASQKVIGSGLFTTLTLEDIPTTEADYGSAVEKLRNELESKGFKGMSQRETLWNSMSKTISDVDHTVIKEDIQTSLNEITKIAKIELSNWDIYDQIRKATGNENLALTVSGLNVDNISYPKMIKNQFNDMYKGMQSTDTTLPDATFDSITPEIAKTLPKTLEDAWNDAAQKLADYEKTQQDFMNNVLSEYQSLSDKIKALDFNAALKIDAVKNSDMPEEQKQTYIQRIEADTNSEKFAQSAEYLQFYSGIYSLVQEKAVEIGDLIQQNLDAKLQAGIISAEEYYNEVTRISTQLNSLNNVKSDFLTFSTSGQQGLNEKKLDIANSNVLASLTKVKDTEDELAEARLSGNKERIVAAELSHKIARQEYNDQLNIRDGIQSNITAWGQLQAKLQVVSSMSDMLNRFHDATNTIMESFGIDTSTSSWDYIATVTQAIVQVSQGMIKVIQAYNNDNPYEAMAASIETVSSVSAMMGDRDSRNDLYKKRKYLMALEEAYDLLATKIEYFLGNAALMDTSITGGAYGSQIENLKGQLVETEKVLEKERNASRKDKMTIAEYEEQIEELKLEIQNYATDIAEEVYGIDLQGWAEQLGDALVEAFANGEDAAEAFDDTVSDILRDMVSSMASNDIIAPMFNNLKTYLFGEDGISGAFGEDYMLDETELGVIKNYIDQIKNKGIPAVQELYDAINEVTDGMLDDVEQADGLSAGIQSITEDTADLLASYVNAIRADVSLSVIKWDKLLGEQIPKLSTLTQAQLHCQQKIAENTLRTATATEAILEASNNINDILRRATQGTSNGFYVR